MTTVIVITITCEDFIRRKLDGNITTKGFEGKLTLQISSRRQQFSALPAEQNSMASMMTI